MTISGFQDFWPAGSRFYFRRDPVASVEQPFVDLGVVEPANPTIAATKIELKDSDGGRKTTADETTIDLTESYDLVCRNLNPTNRAILWLANSPSAHTQTQTEKTVDHWLTPGGLVKVKDSDTSATLLHGFDAISGVYTGTVLTKALVGTGTAINAATKTITLTGDQTAVAGLAPAKVIIVNSGGLANKLNARSYTIVSRTLNGGATDLVVSEAPVANETGVTGTVTHENAGTIYKQDVDWSVYNRYRGFVKVIEGGAIAAAATCKVVFTTAALTGNRLILPMSAQGEIKGDGLVYWERGGFKEGTVREFRCSITPSSSQIQVDDYSSMTLTVKVLSDLTAAVIAGRMIDYRGSIPTSS